MQRDPLSFLDVSLPELAYRSATQRLTQRWMGQFIDDYRIEEFVGSGTHGVVFRGRRTSPFDRTVAIKLLPNLRGQAKAEQFKNECQALADLDHPNISTIFTAGLTEDSTPYLIMPFLDGSPIDEYVDRNECGIDEIADQMRQLASAISYAYRRGVIHCDLKPDNIIVDDLGQVTVTDFGLAVRVDELADLTQRPSWAPGTIGYAAPEVLTSREYATSAVDVYSLGAIMYRLLTGQPPHQYTGWIDTLLATVSETPSPVRSLNGEVPAGLAEICEKCLAKDPSDRYATASELGLAIEEFLEHRKSESEPKPNRVALWSGAAVVALLGMIACFSYLWYPTNSTGTPNAAGMNSVGSDTLSDKQIEWILNGIEEQLLRPGLRDPAEPGDFEATYLVLQDAAKELEALLEMAPNHKTVRHRTATGYFLLGRSAYWLGERDYAWSSLKRSEQMFRQLHQEYPADGFLFDFFHTLLVQGSLTESVVARHDTHLLALEIIEGLHDADRDNLDFADARACMLVLVAEDHSHKDYPELFDIEAAYAYAAECKEWAEWTCRQPDSKPLHRKQIMNAAAQLCYIAELQGDQERALELAEEAYTESVRLDEALQIADSKNLRFRNCVNYMGSLRKSEQFDKAIGLYDEAERLVKNLREVNWPEADNCELKLQLMKQSIEEKKNENLQQLTAEAKKKNALDPK